MALLIRKPQGCAERNNWLEETYKLRTLCLFHFRYCFTQRQGSTWLLLRRLDSGACPGPRSGIRRNDVNLAYSVIPAKAGIQVLPLLIEILRNLFNEHTIH